MTTALLQIHMTYIFQNKFRVIILGSLVYSLFRNSKHMFCFEDIFL